MSCCSWTICERIPPCAMHLPPAACVCMGGSYHFEKGKVESYDPLTGLFAPLEDQVRQRLLENAEKSAQPRTEWETHI